MPQDGIQIIEESFNSFLAGVFLTRNCINNFEFFNLMSTFEERYNVDIISDDKDLCVSIYLDDVKMKLRNGLSDVITINNREITVYDYLYSFTSLNVRSFFNIPDIEKLEGIKSNFSGTNAFIKRLSRSKKKAII